MTIIKKTRKTNNGVSNNYNTRKDMKTEIAYFPRADEHLLLSGVLIVIMHTTNTIF